MCGFFFLHAYNANDANVCEVAPTVTGNVGFVNELDGFDAFYTTFYSGQICWWQIGSKPLSISGGIEVGSI